MRRDRLVVLAAVVATLAPASAARALDKNFLEFDATRASNGQVTVDAESISYDQPPNVITAQGAVKVTRGDMVLTAEVIVEMLRLHGAS